MNAHKLYYPCCWLLLSMHLAGLIGLQLSYTHDLFVALTPFNLIITGLIVLLFHRDFSRAFGLFSLVTALAGYLVEVAGVHTGYIFGTYTYGSVLGYRWWDVPLLIGLNWFILVYCTGIMANRWQAPIWQKALLGAGMMVLLDLFIEPVAIRYGFWAWQGDEVPVQNYVAWFLVSWLLLLLFYRLPFRKYNPIAAVVYAAQFLFFAGTLLAEKLLNLF